MAPDTIVEDFAELRSNAWCGEAAHGAVRDGSVAWGIDPAFAYDGPKLAPEPVDLANWRDPRVGWGVVLADNDATPAKERAAGDDAPAAIRQLIAARAGAQVFRYRTDLPEGRLRWYAADGAASDLRLSGARGSGPKQIPRYLLIVGSPATIPWRAQCRWQLDAFVGRLDLDDAGLANYVDAVLHDWADARPDVTRPVVWAVDHGYPDITRLMRRAIADPIRSAFATDAGHEFDVADGYLADGRATGRLLADALASRRPAFVLTSSHGATFPLNDVAAMQRRLGMLVDNTQSLLTADEVTTGAAHGAVWYAHACCSAGSDGASRFVDSVEASSSLARTLSGVSQCGAMTAPLPRALLGSAKPARAFIGHVEPTFNWTLRDPETGQVLTNAIVQALYDQLHLAVRPPVGLAMKTYYDNVGGLLQDHAEALERVTQQRPGAPEQARRAKLVAIDRLSMVVLGDPTVALPRKA